MACHGNGPDHCCYVDGQVCPFLEERSEKDRRWTCGLRRSLGSWEAVHSDPRYLATVRPVWDRTGTTDCGEFGPGTGQCCWGYWENPDAPSVVNVSIVGLGKPLRPSRTGKRVG